MHAHVSQTTLGIDDVGSPECRTVVQEDAERPGKLLGRIGEHRIPHAAKAFFALEPGLVAEEAVGAGTNDDCAFTLELVLHRGIRGNFRWTNKREVPRIEEENEPLSPVIRE
jgi:hypothetical protein